MEKLNGLPVLPARNISKDYCETETCPYCGQKHKHGRGEVGSVGHKVAHCPPFEIVNKNHSRDVWAWVKDKPELIATLKNNPGYYVKIIG